MTSFMTFFLDATGDMLLKEAKITITSVFLQKESVKDAGSVAGSMGQAVFPFKKCVIL